MTVNVGTPDRIIRLLIAATLLFLSTNQTLTGIYNYAALAVAIILLLTSMVKFCPLYAIFGISTCRKA
jgi:hypothetical protein